MTGPERTLVHLVRHGEVHNPDKVLYGRLDGYHLSERGYAMAEAVADYLAPRDITRVIASSLTRAQETAAPIAARHDLPITTDDRVIEAANDFEGQQVTLFTFLRPKHLARLYDVRRPSWGEPYVEIVARMEAAVADARAAAAGHEAVLVSHQLPVWMMRSAVEGRRLWHDPRRRECSLASVTTLTYTGTELTSLTYAEPARHLLDSQSASVGA